MFSTRSYEGALDAAQRNNNLLTSINNRALDFRRERMRGAMDKVQSNEEDTMDSGSGSGSLDLAALENETDDFGRLLLQHHRETRRLENATRGQQAFRKARPHPRIAERLEREEREREQLENQTHERPSSGGSYDSDPPLTVPREWGRHARKQTGWLRKIVAASEDGDELAAGVIGDQIYRQSTAYTGDADWKAEPVRPIEQTPASLSRGRYATTPSSLNHMNTTLRPFADLDNLSQDFTSNSLLQSTPLPPKHYRRIDELARREIEELENQAVTTRALDQIDQHSPHATLRRTSSARLRERAIADGLGVPVMRPSAAAGKSKSPSRIPIRQQNGSASRNTTSRNEDHGRVASSVNGAAQPTTHKLPRPTHRREDSMSLLRKLARVSSMSPSPGRASASPEEAPGGMVGETKSDDGAKHDEYGHARANNDAVNHHIDTTPLPQTPSAEPRTPVVAGAWIDTTVNAGVEPQHGSVAAAIKAENSEEDKHINLAHRDHKQPKSALEDIMREVKAVNTTPLFGESTIQSLEDIAHPNTDPNDSSAAMESAGQPKDTAQPVTEDEHVLTQTEKDRRQETLAMEAMNKHLRTARTSIKDANRGLRRVENKIDTARVTPSSGSSGGTFVIQRSSNHGHTPCPECGGCYQSVWKALWFEFLSCFFTWDPNSKLHIRFTWLGLACLLWCTWFVSECAMCSYYCRPLYTYAVMSDYIDPDAPEFPFVIPTVLFRPLRWLWKPVCDVLAAALGVVFHTTFSDSSLSSDPPALAARAKSGETIKRAMGNTPVMRSEWMATATTGAARVVSSFVDAVDEVGSMWDDAFMS